MAQLPVRDDFDAPTLSWQWNWLGTPGNMPARVENGTLYIRALAEKVTSEPAPRPKMPDFSQMTPEQMEEIRKAMRGSRKIDARALGWVGRRQQHPSYTARPKLRFAAAENEAAGLMVVQDKYNQLRIELTRIEGRRVLRVVRFAEIAPNEHVGDILPVIPIHEEHGETVLGVLPWEGDEAVLQLEANGQSNSFYAGVDEDHLIPVALNIDGRFMGSETAGGFVGAYVAMFATANGGQSSNEAAFDWFDYCGS